MTTIALLCALKLGAATPDPAIHELDEVTVVATRTERTLKSTPGTITVKTSESLKRELAQSIKDAVRYEAGVSVQNQPSRFGLAGFNIRGLDANRVLIEVDGARIADSFSIGSFSNAGRDAVELGVLKRVEIVRGSASSLYGSAAMGGVVAYTTRDASDFLQADESVASESRLGISGEDQARYVGSNLAFGSGDLGAFISLNRREFEAYETAGSRTGSGSQRNAPNPQESSRNALLAKFNAKLGDAHAFEFTLDGSEGKNKTNVLSGVGTQTIATTVISTSSLLGDDSAKRRRAALHYQLSANSMMFDGASFNAFSQSSSTDQATLETRSSNTRAVVSPSERTRNFSFDQRLVGSDLRAEKTFDWDAGTHRLTYGASFLRTETEQLRSGTARNLLTGVTSAVVGPDVFPVRDFPNSSASESSLYVQSELDWNELGLTIIPGIRADRYRLSPELDTVFADDNPGIVPTKLSETAVSPKLGALYRLREGLSLQAQYAEGYRAPPYSDVNVGFTNLQFGYTAIPNNTLKSESSRSVEIGVRADGAMGFIDFVSYSNRYADFIESFVFIGVDPVSRLQTFQSQNLGSVKIRGTELRGRLIAGELNAALEGFELRAALATSHGDDRTNNTPLLSIDPAKAVLGIAYSAASWRVELIGTAVKRKGRVGDPNLFRSPGYGSVDLLAQWRFNDKLSLDIAVFNLADRSYFDWSDVRGRFATDPGILRFSRPGRNTSAAFNISF